jgi:S-formylglutathione hydrolase FrmB
VARELAFNIILPAGYERSAKRYPVLYLLHGRGSDLNSWPGMGVPEYAAEYDLIVVMPDGGSSWYVNWAKSGGGEKSDWEDCIIKDLIGHVDGHYRTVASRAGRAIDGFSMGGYGALTLGFLHPDMFCSVNSHSGALRFMDRLRAHLNGEDVDPLIVSPERTAEFKAEAAAANSLKGLTPQGRMVTSLEECDAIDPFHLVLAVPREQLPDIRIDCGMDENLFEYSRKFAELLMEHKISFTYAQAPGRHDGENWSRAVKHSMAHQYAVLMKQLGGVLPDDPGKSE